jgi:hypothetical protein
MHLNCSKKCNKSLFSRVRAMETRLIWMLFDFRSTFMIFDVCSFDVYGVRRSFVRHLWRSTFVRSTFIHICNIWRSFVRRSFVLRSFVRRLYVVPHSHKKTSARLFVLISLTQFWLRLFIIPKIIHLNSKFIYNTRWHVVPIMHFTTKTLVCIETL